MTAPWVPHVVIVGGGFGGLYAAQALGNQPVKVTLIDKRNFHLFQPLLYQIATGSLSPGDIASPLRTVVKKFSNVRVIMDEVLDIDPQAKTLKLKHNAEGVSYDMLVLATGGMTHYFGNDAWAQHTQSLKTVEEALDMRRKVFMAFEKAEQEPDPQKRDALMNFVIVGGGPTGVELAGALAELSRFSMPSDFKNIDCRRANIILVEMGPRVLAAYPEDLSQKAGETLERLGVTLRTGTSVTDIQEGMITLSAQGNTEHIPAETILWAAGVKASPLGQLLCEKTGCELDRGGRVIVEADLSVPKHPEIFIVGDLANYSHTPDKRPLPGVAPVAMQQGRYLAQSILKRQKGQSVQPFKYLNKGNLAVIGINEAVADLHKVHLSGFPAWFIWAFVHVMYLVEFDNKVLVMLQWLWAFFTRRHSARLITGKGSYD
ncbi:NAD(P)/FAD-dependent oxidoreductase [Vampirovibrio chlorellavorus]|uniref:NAD(P)/FAD-dependent oxidoreductase n=1 Tax=Vampirovibrio chlorellavorus TaxID=758823 RepID=UPI0026ECC241|nr:NAD(P)/FAD-dependent oxidoreductase [Vampirovibrio chlorellavorus]